MLVGAVGIETSVLPTSPADSIALAPTPSSQKPTTTGILRPNCDRVFSQFSEHYWLRVKRDDCGDPIIRGKLGHLYEYSAGRIGIVLEAPSKSAALDATLRSRKRRAIAAGFNLRQEGDSEAILLFDPADTKQARLAIQLIHAKKIKKAPRPTDAQLRARALFSSKARSKRPCFAQMTNAVVGQGD
jgi:hypothetical protein